MIGDEILVLDRSKNLHTPYVVIGLHTILISLRTTRNIMKSIPIDITDEERLGELISGGGRRRLTHLYPNDTWHVKTRIFKGRIK